MKHLNTGLICCVGLIAGLSFIDAPYPKFQWLHHLPTPLFIGLLIFASYKFSLSRASVLCFLGFYLVHIIGARYIYSLVPYDLWTQELFGFSLNESCGFTRNHYDRLAHFAYGALIALPIFRLHQGLLNNRRLYSIYGTIVFIVASSALYELFEWLLAINANTAFAESYNGQQGDIWDAHKDVALATLGCFVALSPIVWLSKPAKPEP